MSEGAEIIGTRLRDAYAISVAEGHALLNSYVSADKFEVFHVPEVPGDGPQALRPEDVNREAGALDKLGGRLSVDVVRPVGLDTVILERVLTGTLPNGDPFR